LTHYTVLEEFSRASLVDCRLATGRTHQIRVHFSHKGHPLMGDPLYGRKNLVDVGGDGNFGRQALHAYSLGFVHPQTTQELFFTSDIPVYMADLLKILRNNPVGK
jgi:23S rRNA pseudouridine1911/1915/1917 synthase